MGKIGVVGSINMDMTVKAERIPLKGETLKGEDLKYIPGGKGANQAVAAAKLGAKVEMFGCVGDDAAGESLVKNLQEMGVETKCIKTVAGVPTGLAMITVGENDNTIVVVAGTNDCVDVAYVALVKGPLVYCLEETDNGGNLSGIFADAKGELTETYEDGLLGGVTTVTFSGKRLKDTAWKDGELYADRENTFEDVTLKAVPYHCWGNREHGEMQVWMKELL